MINEAVYAFGWDCRSFRNRQGNELEQAIPMGPLALADFIGLDVTLAIMENLHSELGDDKYRPCPLLKKMVRGGLLGRKSKAGFFTY